MNKEAFYSGFVHQCAEEGFTVKEAVFLYKAALDYSYSPGFGNDQQNMLLQGLRTNELSKLQRGQTIQPIHVPKVTDKPFKQKAFKPDIRSRALKELQSANEEMSTQALSSSLRNAALGPIETSRVRFVR